MKVYKTSQIRNIALLGHLGCGKTSMTEALLFVSKAISKKGEVERKTTVSDYLVEEQNRQTSLTTSLIPIEWQDYKINFLDTPGSEEFNGEIENVLSVVDGAVVFVDATKGVEVGTERVWESLREKNIPTIVFINKLDKENVKINQVLDSVKTNFGAKALPLTWVLDSGEDFTGYVNVITNQGYDLSGAEVASSRFNQGVVDGFKEAINEAVAETSEELLDKFFGGEELTSEEIASGLKEGTANSEIFPVLVGSALKNVGVSELLNKIIELLPAPDYKIAKGVNPKDHTEVDRKITSDAPFSAYVFKTIVDPFLGTINFFKVMSGTTQGVSEAYLPSSDLNIKLGTIITMMGKTQINVDMLNAGDIGAVTKTGELATGLTICDRKSPIVYPPVVFQTPVIYIAIAAKTKQDEDKLSSTLQKLNLEDPSFEIRRNPETAQLLVGGQGMTHLGYILEKMKNMFKVDVDVLEPKIVYRETIRKVGSAQGRHKKQSGGAGQFGDVHIRFEPTEAVFEFASEVVGGSVPKNYFPAVEKGLLDTLEHGPLAGFPVIGVKAVLFDGSYHPVDSNEISFKLAAALAFKEACKSIKPTILEPIMEVKVIVKNDYVGDVMGDMNKRRGQVLGIDPLANGKQCITAQVPESEITKYATDLKAMTQGSGQFSRSFLRYDDVPEMLVAKIIEEYKKERE